MSAFYKFLFPMKPDGTAISLLLLALRLLFGGLLLSHGIQKWTNFESMSAAFPDPLGVGHSVSLKELAFVYLVIFILMYIAGPGKFSLDRLIAVLLSQKR